MKRKHKPESKRGRATGGFYTLFPERCFARLREAGLIVIEAECCHLIVKPESVPGNSLPLEDRPAVDPGREVPPTDAPYSWLWHEWGMWQVGQEGPWRSEPGENRAFGTPAGAVTHVLDFYFGDSGRMRAWAEQRTLRQRKAAEETERRPDPKANLCHIKGCVEPNLGYSQFCRRHHKPEWWQRYKL